MYLAIMDMMHLVMAHGVGTLFGYHFVEEVLMQSWRGLVLFDNTHSNSLWADCQSSCGTVSSFEDMPGTLLHRR